MEESIIVGIDVGTTKVCTLIARVEEGRRIRILGVGVEPARGMRKGAVVDLGAAAQAILRSVDKAERSSGLEVNAALVSMAGSQITAVNNKGVVGINGSVIDEVDVARALESARAVPLDHNREIIHVIQRSFTVDGQEGVRSPVGMHGFRLEVEAHIITAAASGVENLRQAVAGSGVEVTQFVLNPLASAEVALSETEREMGVIVCDIGGGTTDLAIYIEGDVWHTAVLGVGGSHITSDIAHGLRLPTDHAEEVKKHHGHADKTSVPPEEAFTVKPFGEEAPFQVTRQDLAHIIGARVEEIFGLVMQEVKRSGYDGLLPAGIVLTGGTALLPGIRGVASEVLNMPARVAMPQNLIGMTDQLNSPAYATSVGLLHWALLMNEFALPTTRRRRGLAIGGGPTWQKLIEFFRRLLP